MSGMQTLTTIPSVITSVAPIDNCNVITPAGVPVVDPCPNITNTSFMVPTIQCDYQGRYAVYKRDSYIS